MKILTHSAIAIAAFVLIGSSAAAQTAAAGAPVSLREASRFFLPAETLGHQRNPIQVVTGRLDRVQTTLTRSAGAYGQTKRGSPAGKNANVVLAAVLGGLAGLYVGGAAETFFREGTNPEYFSISVGGPIGAVVGGTLAARYVRRRQRP